MKDHLVHEHNETLNSMSVHFTRQQFVILEHGIDAIEINESKL
jgi:hypothetical protein